MALQCTKRNRKLKPVIFAANVEGHEPKKKQTECTIRPFRRNNIIVNAVHRVWKTLSSFYIVDAQHLLIVGASFASSSSFHI